MGNSEENKIEIPFELREQIYLERKRIFQEVSIQLLPYFESHQPWLRVPLEVIIEWTDMIVNEGEKYAVYAFGG